MRHYDALKKVVCFIGLNAMSVWAGPLFKRDTYRDIRWLGRGNAGIAVVNDGTSVFYNPGGIGNIEDYNFTITNPSAGGNQNFVSSFQELVSLGGSNESLTQKFSPFLGKPLGLQGSVFPNIAIPSFVVGFWDYFDFQFEYRNPVNPQLSVEGRNDYGFIIGTGKKIHENLSVGMSLRYQKRKVVSELITGATLLTDTSSYLTSLFRNGEGWGLNIGAQYKKKVGKAQFVALGFAVEDLGQTRFVDQNSSRYPAPQQQKVNLGSAFGFNTNWLDGLVLLDVKQLTENDSSNTKKIYTGLELSFLKMEVRGGYFQGYWTAGLSVRLFPFLDLDFATYGEELDTAAGLRENRMWMIGVSSGLELKKTKKRRQRFDLSHL